MGLTHIKLDEVYGKIDEAIKNQTKSILFVGSVNIGKKTRVMNYFKDNKDINYYSDYPMPYYEDFDGKFGKAKYEGSDVYMYSPDQLDLFSYGNTVIIVNKIFGPLEGDESKEYKWLYQIANNKEFFKLHNNTVCVEEVPNLKMVIGITWPRAEGGMTEHDYEYFDEVYIIEK